MSLHRTAILELAAKHRIVAIYDDPVDVEAGGLMYYGVNRQEVFRRIAFYLDRILKGAKPADLPVAQPTKFDLTINIRAAKTLGLIVPPSLLRQADRLIE